MIKKISLGADPGSSTGAIAWIIETAGGRIDVGSVRFDNSSEKEISDKIKEIASIRNQFQCSIFCYVEKVGSMPGEGHKGALTFGENIGWIRGTLMALNIPFDYVAPRSWQREFVPAATGRIVLNKKTKQEAGYDVMSADQKSEYEKKVKKHNEGIKTEHKRKIKAVAERMFPGIKVVNNNADAIVIAKYCQLKTQNEQK